MAAMFMKIDTNCDGTVDWVRYYTTSATEMYCVSTCMCVLFVCLYVCYCFVCLFVCLFVLALLTG